MMYGNKFIQDARKLEDNCTVELLVKDIRGGLHTLKVFDGDLYKYQKGELIQACFPYLSADERELLITGFTAEMWDMVFPEDDNTI